MKTMTLMAVAALAAAWGLSGGALASSGAARSAVPAQDMRVEPAAMRGGRVRASRSMNRDPDVNRDINGNVVVPRIVVRRGWVRPSRYWWAPGTAIAAGAAGGVATAPVAARWAGAAPGRNMCWFFTGPRFRDRRQGFWDLCQ